MTTVTSAEGELVFGTGHPTVIAAMLINTLKDEVLASDLAQGRLDRVKRLAEAQRVGGVGLLDIMVSHPDLREEDILPRAAMMAHDASGLPICLDSINVEALKRTLDVFPYKALIPVNGEDARLGAILPLARESGSGIVGLCMDERGIPRTVEGRVEVAGKIVSRAREIGMTLDDVIIDPLCITAAVAQESLQIALGVLREVKARFGVTTFLGIDNAGFGMPQKDYIDLAYLIAAIPAGCDVALLEPPTCSTLGIEGLTLLYAADFLSGNDPYGRRYLAHIRKHKLAGKMR